MGNLAFVSSRKNLRPEDVDALLREVNHRRFGDYFRIERPYDTVWSFHPPEDEPGFLWEFYLRDTLRKISSNHPFRVAWQYWAWHVFQHEMAAAWNGRLSDEGGEGTWAPDLAKYAKFEDWQDLWYSRGNSFLPKDYAEQARREELDAVPDVLRPLILRTHREERHENQSEP